MNHTRLLVSERLGGAFLALAVLLGLLSLWTDFALLAALVLCIILLTYLFFWHFNYFMALFVFMIPLSLPKEFGGNVISLPSESILFGLGLLFILRSLFFSLPDKKVLKHPLTILLLIELFWMLVTSLTSTMIDVSVKRFLMRSLFFVVFYFSFIPLLKEARNVKLFFMAYGLGMVIPIINTLINHSQYRFVMRASFFVTEPFYPDHTIYAACISFVLAGLMVLLLNKESKRNLLGLVTLGLLVLLLMIGDYFSFSRAAWASLAGSLVLFVLIKLRMSLKIILAIASAALFVLFLNADRLFDHAESNTAVSSTEDLTEHVQSLTNISNDASNAERLNRYSCAIRMFLDKPIVGFGPGTYQFQYGSYQRPEEMTRISTYRGDKGNAHSEYLTALSESGLPGLLIMLLVLWTVFKQAWELQLNSNNAQRRLVGLIAILCLTTYYIHGLVNTFIDNDKAAVLVYAAFAMMVATNIKEEEELASPQK